MKKLLILFIISYTHFQLKAQVAISSNGNQPAASAMLDVSATNKGMLMPRMTTAQRNDIQNPDTGLMVFDTDRQTIYFFDGQKWRPMMTATESTAPLMSRQPVGAKAFSQFGTSADIYDNYAVVGAPADSAKGVDGGAVYIFSKLGGSWKQVAKLSAPNPQANEHFGASVSLHGDLLVVGAPNRTVNGLTFRGAIYVFKAIGHLWNYQGMLTASNGAGSDYFGHAVSTNGTYVLSGAPYTDHNGKTNAGSVYVYGLQNNVWTQKAIINANDPKSQAHFGISLDMWQSKLAVGAPNADAPSLNGITNAGAVYVYNNTDASGFTWILGQKITPGEAHEQMWFGSSVAIENNTIICGAPQYSGMVGKYNGFHAGCGFQYGYENGSWKPKLIMIETGKTNRAGTSVALTNGTSFAGMPAWKEERGKLMIAGAGDRYYYDEDPNLEHKFGSVVAAHNNQFIVTAFEPFVAYGRVFFGVVD